MKLSVIVPVYNVESYLERCINSIYDHQDLDKDEYEIIAVNDGATDNSLNILRDLSQKILNLKIISQENKGLSGARNTGIKAALGRFLLFVDADDIITHNSIRRLTYIAEKNDLDILEFGAYGISESGKILYKAQTNTSSKILKGKQYLSNINFINSACNKLYKREFINRKNLFFKEKVFVEDIEFNCRAIYLSDRIMAIENVYAHFYSRENSITRNRNFANNKKMIYDIYKVMCSISEFKASIKRLDIASSNAIDKKLNALTATLLLRVLMGIDNYDIKLDILKKLKQKNFFPTRGSSGDFNKDLFLIFTRISPLFSTICFLNCKLNHVKNN